MAVVIRLQRTGKPQHPHFRVVAIERSRGPHGQPIEVLGHYHPKGEKLKKAVIDLERVAYWIGKGALPSETVESLIKAAKKAQPAAAA